MTTAAAAGPEPQPSTRVRIICSHCDRVITRHSRRGLTVSCPHCKTVNAGPGLVAEQGKAKDPGALRRRTRRVRTAEQRADRAAAATSQQSPPEPSAPARPVRRRKPAAPATEEAAAPNARSQRRPAARGRQAPAPPPSTRRGGFVAGFRRAMGYAEEDQAA